MKFLPIFSSVVLASLSTAFAITGADIAPAALAGKTLIFEITNGGAPYADSGGTWSMTFSGTGTSFTAANITGNTVPVPTTSCTATSDGSSTTFTLAKFIEGQNAATLYLYTTMTGEGGYELFIDGVNGVSLNGPFTIGSPPVVKGPEIAVQQGKDGLVDGVSKKKFGTVLVGKSISKTFTIKNSGPDALKNIAITIDGKNKAEFTVSGPGKTSLAKDKNTTFVVTFKPKAIGVRDAAIHIKSNDKNESPFDIKLSGTGGGIK